MLHDHLSPATSRFKSVAPPGHSIFRVGGRRGGSRGVEFDPFDPPPFRATSNNRFDNPRVKHWMNRIDWLFKRRIEAHKEEWFRVIYCATDQTAAFGETIQTIRPDNEKIREIFGSSTQFIPELHSGLLPVEWITRRLIGETQLDPTLSLPFFDLMDADNLQALNYEAPIAQAIGKVKLNEVDVSAVTGTGRQHRNLTQAIALHIYNQVDAKGHPAFAGIRYGSHLNYPNWECWAIFYDRLHHKSGWPRTEEIELSNPHLLGATIFLKLRMP